MPSTRQRGRGTPVSHSTGRSIPEHGAAPGKALPLVPWGSARRLPASEVYRHPWGEPWGPPVLKMLCPTGVTQPRWGTWGWMLRPSEGSSPGVRLTGRWAAGTRALGRGSPAGSACAAPVPTEVSTGLALVASAPAWPSSASASAATWLQGPQRPACPPASGTSCCPRCHHGFGAVRAMPLATGHPAMGQPQGSRAVPCPSTATPPLSLAPVLKPSVATDRACLVNKVMKQLRQTTEEPECLFRHSHRGKGV